ncbi:MAG: hypothetical protein FWE74_01430 [Oscillospiraceae bacterium]|nr:hypothetical protein [Oscillospiraceae bacterium]
MKKELNENMTSGMEIQIMQKEKLFDLLMLKKDMLNEDSNDNVKYLDRLIVKTQASMQAEEVIEDVLLEAREKSAYKYEKNQPEE